MSALGNPGKFSFCIAENEEENPWEPFHVTSGLKREQSAVSLFAAEPPRGVSEHTAPAGKTVLETISLRAGHGLELPHVPDAGGDCGSLPGACEDHPSRWFYQSSRRGNFFLKIRAYLSGITRKRSARKAHS